MTGENKREKLMCQAQDELHRGMKDGFQLMLSDEVDGGFRIVDYKEEVWTEMSLHNELFRSLKRWRKAFRMGFERGEQHGKVDEGRAGIADEAGQDV